jgi:hypothetical protein
MGVWWGEEGGEKGRGWVKITIYIMFVGVLF